MQSIILAAGKGSRLHPITVNRSKAMLPILGKPIVARVMETLVENGLRDFILVVSPDDREIVNYFERESKLEIRTQFVVQPERRGMADALSRAAEYVQEDFLLTACDNLVSGKDVGKMLSLWNSTPGINSILALMEVPPEKIKSVGIVELEGEWVRHIVEKPDPSQVASNIASMPLYIFSRRILDYLKDVPLSRRGEYELQDAIQMLIERDGGVRGYRAAGRLTLTSSADLLALNRHYLVNGNANHHDFPQSVGKDTKLIPPLHIESGVVIGAGCEIGPNLYIERDCQIGDGAKLSESVLLRGSVVPEDACLEGQVVS
jgi:UDP-N-acetylglucosamine diphosphorylase / glucose-1-phosphate thymidylyltransferase / UDP-N-acetylgalactosamine diphosphorylase / glucosamine-1-phosphate N-acetyltransferase / galactosamine-1-phosphate N-acetyltransferase